MKKLLLLFAALLTLTLADAQRISEQQAFQKAQKFLQDKQVIGQDNARKMNRAPQQPANQAYYIFNVEQQGGFVIVAGDERMSAILGYSDHGQLNMESLPDNLKGLLDYYQQVASGLDGQVGASIQKARKSSMPTIAPLITTQWDQAEPYNILCPQIGPNEHLLTGCVATAMAQIINYTKWPVGETSSVPAYTTEGLNIYMPELQPTTFDWDNMDDQSIARLMLYCGQSVYMNYEPGGSGANSAIVPEALRNVFGYSTLTMLKQRSSYSDEDWESLIHGELSEQRPVFYSGFGGTGGHAFIVDGYEDGRFHINWGWNGNCDGMFLLTNLTPYEGADFSQGQNAVIGIRPPKDGDPSEPPVDPNDGLIKYGTTTIDGVSYELSSFGNNFYAMVIPNLITGKYSGDIYVPDSVVYDNHRFCVKYLNWPSPFIDCDELTSLSLAIYNVSVQGCPKLKNLEPREGVLYLDIYNCPSLEHLVLPKSLSDFSIWGCGELKTMRFLASGKISFNGQVIGSEADMPSLTDVYFLTDKPPVVRNLPDNGMTINPNVTIHIPEGSKENYENSVWKGWNFLEDQPEVKPAIVWGYCVGDEVSNFGTATGGGENDCEFAIHAPASEMAAFKGNRISKIQYFSSSEAPTYVFITTPGVDYLIKQTVQTIDGTWNTIELDEPLDITGEELLVGVGRPHSIGMSYSTETSPDYDGVWRRYMGSDTEAGMVPGAWERYGTMYPIPIRFFIESDNPIVGATIVELGIVYNNSGLSDAAEGDYFVATIKSRSVQPISSYIIEYTIDGTVKGGQSFETDLQPSYLEKVVIPVPSLTGQSHTAVMRITKVNGNENPMADVTSTLDFVSASVGRYPRRIVMEEGTGTWCGYCPRGMATIKRLTQEYPDNFIGIALHCDDEMDGAENYKDISNKFWSFPSSYINRIVEIDPSYPIIRNAVELELNGANAKIGAEAYYASNDSSLVTVVTQTEFAYDDSNGSNYQIAYVVLEDNVGPYGQSNYYSNPSSEHTDDYMDWWMHQDGIVSILFNDVARGIYGNSKGVKGSIPENITEGVNYQYAYTLTLPDNIDSKKNIRIVTLLIDTKSGEILNADQTQVVYDPDAIPLIITANSYSRKYGEENPAFEYTVNGGTMEGTPEITCEATATSPIGTYPIIVSQGTVTNNSVTYIAGTLTIEAAPLTISAGEYTKRQYEPMPELKLTYEGFKNGETNAVLTKQPTVSCDATESSAPGEYPVVISGAEAQNYDISYINGTLTVTEPASYTLTYLVDGEVYKTFTLKQNETITPEPEPEKDGYTFSGWSEIPDVMPAHDVTVTGSFSINSYKLTYLVDDEEYKTYELEYGAAITPEAEPTKEGYTFSGWSEIPDVMPAHDVTVSGTFSINSYKLIYLVDGETYKTSDVEYGAAITPEAEPEKEGYTFSGWSEIPDVMPAHDVIVTGTFSINSYKLTYIVDGEEYKTCELEYGASITPEAEPEKEGYTFSGWSEIPETMPAYDVTVIGTFSINSYKLTYIVDGEEYKSYELEYGTAIIPEAEPIKEGHTFSGWSEIPEAMPAHDVTVTGTFAVNTYKLTYMIDDEVYKEVIYEYGATITPEPQPEGDYARFEWIGVPETMPANDVTVYASYETGIIDLLTLQGVKAIYAPNGKKLDKPQKGLNIIIMNDGKVKRVVVK